MKFGEAHKYMSFRMYKVLHEDNLPVGEVMTQAKLHEGFINSSLLRILHEVHGLVTPHGPDSMFQEERMAKLYSAFSPQEYECLKNALALIYVNKTLDLEKAMKTLQWFKVSTCPCTQHAVRMGGKQWQLRPTSTVPSEIILQLPAISTPTILQRRKAKQDVLEQASLLVETSSISSGETLLQNEFENEPAIEPTEAEKFNQKMKEYFQNSTIQQIISGTNMGLLSELCSQLLKEVKQANPLKWVNHVNNARNEDDELVYWKTQMKQDVDTMVSQIQTQLYTGLDVIFGEMNNIFIEEKEEAAQEVTEAEEID